jgi:mannose/fructose/N-acetylgalactosamine-specific phosphotransferase system component IID
MSADSKSHEPRSARASSLFAGFLSSFALQAGYNYDGFQNVGLAAVLLPALKDLYPDPDERAAAVRRHLTYFNAHPYLASFAAGVLINAEEKRANGDPEALDDLTIARIKHAMGSLLGNIGDRLFWAGLLPLAALLGTIAYLFEPLYGALCLLLVYNIPHLLVRAEGLRLGYQNGREILREISGPRGSAVIRWVKRLAAFAAGILIPLTVAHSRTPSGVEGALLVMLPLLLLYWLMARRANRVLALLVTVTLVSLYSLLG